MGDIHAEKVIMKARLICGLGFMLVGMNSSVAQRWSSSEVVLSPDEAKRRVMLSINGSASDSYLLSRYYSWEETYNFANYYFFLRLSAEQGSCEGIWEFAKLQRTIIKDLSDGVDWEARAKATCRRP